MQRTVLLLIGLVMAIAACGGGDGAETTAARGLSGDAANGGELFRQACQSCHGPNAEGIEGIGKPFVGSEFIADQSDAGLVEFIKVGRPADDPLNTTGIMMPPRGSNPSLTDQDLADIVAWIRTLG